MLSGNFVISSTAVLAVLVQCIYVVTELKSRSEETTKTKEMCSAMLLAVTRHLLNDTLIIVQALESQKKII